MGEDDKHLRQKINRALQYITYNRWGKIKMIPRFLLMELGACDIIHWVKKHCTRICLGWEIMNSVWGTFTWLHIWDVWVVESMQLNNTSETQQHRTVTLLAIGVHAVIILSDMCGWYYTRREYKMSLEMALQFWLEIPDIERSYGWKKAYRRCGVLKGIWKETRNM